MSLVLDPLLVPWFQTRTNNGGMGICVSNVGSEILMVAGGIWLLRSTGGKDDEDGTNVTQASGIFDQALLRQLALAFVAGLAMIAAARLLAPLPALAAAPVAVAVYFGCLWMTKVSTRGISTPSHRSWLANSDADETPHRAPYRGKRAPTRSAIANDAVSPGDSMP